ncbi:MAG: DUF2007 domain-containing protein [Xanthomonadaceae bacterium]|nr:DUF2007 domain-containing protein [Xanthomonadaceae bacterium]MDE2244566.1 DUF2007 domain-containing protein [Xanthomonadaceae bacterium]
MRIVYHAESLVDAQLVKDALDAAGIPAFISGAYLTGGIGQLPARDLVTVMVPDPAVEEAARIVADTLPADPGAVPVARGGLDPQPT